MVGGSRLPCTAASAGCRRGAAENPQCSSVAARMVRLRRRPTLSATSEGGTMYKRTLLVLAATALLIVPGASAATTTITISHQTKGCHMWQLGSANPKASLSLTVTAGTALRFVNNDVMPHRLIQQAGPKLTLVRPN